MTAPAIRIEIWSDVVCPWCYIGKRRFERAVEQLDGEIDLDVSYRPYQLDPTASPGRSQPVFDAYAKKFGGPAQATEIIRRVTDAAAEDGIEFHMERALRANTLLSHRLLWWAEQPDGPVGQHELKERLLQAYFVDGLDIGDPDTLADCVAGLGADRRAVLDFLESDAGRAEVGELLDEAAEQGISAVPTFVVNGQWAIPGAQDTATFVQVFRRLQAQLSAGTGAGAGDVDSGDVDSGDVDANACADDACEV